MHFTSFQDMLDSLKPKPSALDFWREIDRLQQGANACTTTTTETNCDGSTSGEQ